MEACVFALARPGGPDRAGLGMAAQPIGITVAEILSVEGNRIRVTGLDALNGTTILDIKPYEEHFDSSVGIEREGVGVQAPSTKLRGEIWND